MKTIKQTNENKITIDMIEQSGALTKEKCDILRHKAKITYLISAKGSGKTILAMVFSIMQMANNPKTGAIGIRKYKALSSTQLAKYWNLTANHLEQYGIPIFSWKKSTNSIMRINSKSDNLKNSEFLFLSLERLSDADGNSSKVSTIVIDEPILAESSDRLYTPQETKEGITQWQNNLEMLKDNYWRFNSKEEKENEKIFVLLNPWNKGHEVVAICDEIFSEEDYIREMFLGHKLEDYLGNFERIEKDWEKLKDSFVKNNTQAVYDEGQDVLVVRQNKFANPVIVENKEAVFKQIRYALEHNDRGKLVMNLGIANDEFADSLNVFGNMVYETTTIEELEANGYNKVNAIHSIDCDTTRVFTIATGILYKKLIPNGINGYLYDYKIYVAPIVEIPANGSGAGGEKLPIYIKLLMQQVEKQVNQYKLHTLSNIVVIDDKRKHFVYAMMQLKPDYPFIKVITTFEQHGAANIIARQNLTQLGINNKVILLDIKNQDLIQDWKVMKRVDVNDPKRITTGTINYLDRIDATEQIIWYYQAYINVPKRKT